LQLDFFLCLFDSVIFLGETVLNSVKAFGAAAMPSERAFVLIIYLDTKLYFYIMPLRCNQDVKQSVHTTSAPPVHLNISIPTILTATMSTAALASNP
jgi:hypothetical protein